ncbi:hypothetical protein GCM10028803_00210 [Larkinella knui]|uniref:Uncharacterized protein n=1 Tax=Larkinella knui TaxID=2025310 RepID=A0A3P1CJJ7_9BACT|nr:hypothetical protein [Larkinella knui]RRB13429.1 hypothetical protein EHT87_14225 [Larkinella knui]
MNIDHLIDLGRLHPGYANTIQELERLKTKTDDSGAIGLLQIFIDGMMRQGDPDVQPLEADPLLKPIGADRGIVRTDQHGNTLHKKIDFVMVHGFPTSVWVTNSFHHRMKFLLDGRIAVTYMGAVQPLCLRMDIQEMGININET